jgi:hypothetical protein
MLATLWQENCFDRQTPIGYHYANAPASSIDAIRNTVFTDFDISVYIFTVRAKLGLQAHSSSLYTIALARGRQLSSDRMAH